MTMLRAFLHMIKIFLIFVICTLFFYFGLVWINQEYENFNRYDQPEGNAIKVSSNGFNDTKTMGILERLELFYRQAE